MEILDMIAQGAILVLSPLAMYMVSNKNKWGFVVGLISQPFWFITTIIHQQWGVTALNVMYTTIWCNGVYTWFKKDPKPETKQD